LVGSVDVRSDDDPVIARTVCADLIDSPRIQSEYGRHCSGALLARLQHQLTATAN
jgi:hypothetical protein